MARIRSIKVDLFVDDGLADVSLEAHFLLAGLPVLADSAGRLEDRPRRIQAQIFPYRPAVDVDACLNELARSGHVVRYEANGVRYLQVQEWARDQRPHVKEAPSVIPPPTDSTEPRLGSELAGNSPGTRRGKSAGIRDSGLGVLDSGSGFFPEAAVASPAPAKKAKEAKKREATGDPRHAPLVKALTDAGYPFLGGKDAKAVSTLLALADQREASRGEAAGVEVLRRARIAWAWVGFPACKSLTELASHWGHYEHEQARGAGPPRATDGLMPAPASECAGCGAEGETASVGEPSVLLGYWCGCMAEWAGAGLHFTKAREWAERRKHGG